VNILPAAPHGTTDQMSPNPAAVPTYLFAGTALASFNALALTTLTLVEALVANFGIIGLMEVLRGVWLSRRPNLHSITYEQIDLVHPSRRCELFADLEKRTGHQREKFVSRRRGNRLVTQ
jgi:hypothetical protein